LTKGDIWLVDIPETVGHEQYGSRPAIVLAEITHYLIMIIVPITKNVGMASAPFTITIQPSTGNGLTVPSLALGLQIGFLMANCADTALFCKHFIVNMQTNTVRLAKP
jgi:mRNA-degrading endonuclease toxin of MazEF toxin-antitoxin module